MSSLFAPRLTVQRSCVLLLTLALTFAAHASNGASNSQKKLPVITSLSPSSTVGGGPGFTLVVQGSNFSSGAKVLWAGSARTTNFYSTTKLTASIAAADLATAGSVAVVVSENAGNSAPVNFTITQPPPVITSISPTSATAGSPATTLQVQGNNFLSGAAVTWNGTALATTFTSSSALSAVVPSADLNTAASYSVAVTETASGGTLSSNSENFTVNPAPSEAIVVSQTANDVAWDNLHQVIYASVPSTAAQNGNSIVAIDPLTGRITASVFAGSEPNRIAISDDDQYLYVGVDGSASVERFILPALTLDINVPIPTDPTYGTLTALDLAVAPGKPHTWAVITGKVGWSPQALGPLTVYDDATARPNVTGRYVAHGSFDLIPEAITWGKDASVIYAANNQSTGFDFYVMPVNSSGLGTVLDYPGVFSGFNNARIHFEPGTGDVYGEDGTVVNPATGTRAGLFAYSGPMTTDGRLNSAFFSGANGAIASFNLTAFTPMATYTFANGTGTPNHLIRWGVNGLAYNTRDQVYNGTSFTIVGNIYIYAGTFVKP